jgi:hypothetical protein
VKGLAMATIRHVSRTALVALALLAISSDVLAQTRVRVIRDQTGIWSTTLLTIATVVAAGTELEVVSQRGLWYEVLLPSPGITERRTGFIAVSQVEAVDPGEPAPPTYAVPSQRPSSGQASRPPTAPRRDLSGSPVAGGFRAFGQAAYGQFLAKETFAAVLGQAEGLWWGGGAAYIFPNGTYIEGSLERFRAIGERVFVFEDHVFPLGLSDTVTVMPLTVTLGYRRGQGALTPYIGVGIGRYFFKEESELAEPSENVSESFTGYHGLVGLEWRSGLFGTAVEAQYAHVPDALDGGLATAFDEHNLGGMNVRVKVFVGR